MSIPVETLDAFGRWAEIATEVPDLRHLEAEVRLMEGGTDLPDWREYRYWQRKLSQLVGWHAPEGSPQDSASYNACHDHLLAVWEGRA